MSRRAQLAGVFVCPPLQLSARRHAALPDSRGRLSPCVQIMLNKETPAPPETAPPKPIRYVKRLLGSEPSSVVRPSLPRAEWFPVRGRRQQPSRLSPDSRFPASPSPNRRGSASFESDGIRPEFSRSPRTETGSRSAIAQTLPARPVACTTRSGLRERTRPIPYSPPPSIPDTALRSAASPLAAGNRDNIFPSRSELWDLLTCTGCTPEPGPSCCRCQR